MKFKRIISKNLTDIMKATHTTRTELSQAISVKYTTLCDWIKGRNYPNLDNLELIANYFHITIYELISDKKIIIIERKNDNE